MKRHLLNAMFLIGNQGTPSVYRMQDGVRLIFASGDTVELHRQNQDFFGKLDETNVQFHQSFSDDLHPYTGDIAYDSWRGLWAYFHGDIKTLGYIYNNIIGPNKGIGMKYWDKRAKE